MYKLLVPKVNHSHIDKNFHQKPSITFIILLLHRHKSGCTTAAAEVAATCWRDSGNIIKTDKVLRLRLLPLQQQTEMPGRRSATSKRSVSEPCQTVTRSRLIALCIHDDTIKKYRPCYSGPASKMLYWSTFVIKCLFTFIDMWTCFYLCMYACIASCNLSALRVLCAK